MIARDVIQKLVGIVGRDNVRTSDEDRTVYSYDGTSTWRHKPDAVVFPTKTAHVDGILRLAVSEMGSTRRPELRLKATAGLSRADVVRIGDRLRHTVVV